MSFKQKLYDKVYNISNRNVFSDDVIDLMETAYSDHKVTLLTLVEFFYPVKKCTNEQAMVEIQHLIRKQYKIEFHNIGSKDDKSVYQRYYNQENITEWLKLLHYLISHFESIKKSQSNVGNKHIAIELGYLDPNEMNKKLITKASRKVTDLLYILKNELNLINVEQKYNYGQKGSWHKITANWDKIIKLFREFDDKANGSIRFRKTIKYRMISFLRYIKENLAEASSFIENIKKLKNKQKYKYLNGLILYKESEDFQANRHVLFKWLKNFHFLESIFDKLNTKYIIPNFNGRELLLEVKDEYVYAVLTHLDGTKFRLKQDYMINATIKPIF